MLFLLYCFQTVQFFFQVTYWHSHQVTSAAWSWIMLCNGEITTRLAKYGFAICSPNPAGNTAKRSLPKKDGAMKPKIENLFELGALKNFLHSRVLFTRVDFSWLIFEIMHWHDRLTPKRRTWPMAFYAPSDNVDNGKLGPSLQAPPLPFVCTACYAGYTLTHTHILTGSNKRFFIFLYVFFKLTIYFDNFWFFT